MEDIELIEKHFRKELNSDETARLTERLATDPAFKRKFETEKLLHKALQFSREREKVRAFATAQAPAPAPALWRDNRSILSVGATALAVWIFSTFSHSLTSLSPEYIKWIGLTLSIAASMAILTWNLKPGTWNLKLTTTALLNGLLVFVLASGFDAINQGMKGIADRTANEAHIVPFTEDKPWWPTHSLEDSLDAHRQQMLELRNQIKNMLSSRLSAGPSLSFGVAPMKFGVVVVPRASTVVAGAKYEADVYLAATPLKQTMEMQVDGKVIPMEADPAGVMRGKVSLTASATTFDNSGAAKKRFMAEIKFQDSTYSKIVVYSVVNPK